MAEPPEKAQRHIDPLRFGIARSVLFEIDRSRVTLALGVLQRPRNGGGSGRLGRYDQRGRNSYVVQVQAIQMAGENDRGRASYVEEMHKDCIEIVNSTVTIEAPELTILDKERLLMDVVARIDEFFAGLEE